MSDDFFKKLLEEMSGGQKNGLRRATDDIYETYQSFMDSGFNSNQAMQLTITTLNAVLTATLSKQSAMPKGENV